MTQRIKFPPVTHVFVGGKLERLDAITVEAAREVIIRLCDQLLEAEREIAEMKNRHHA